MSTRNYWVDLFSGSTWQEFLDAGAHISGFRENRWSIVQQIKSGDYLICYLTGISRWIGVLEVISEPFKDNTPIWKDDIYPSRVQVKPLICLTPETAVPIDELRSELSIFENLSSPNAWTGHVRSTPSKWKAPDGEAVVRAIQEAQRNPISRPVDRRKLERRPTILHTKIGTVTVPENDEPSEEQEDSFIEPFGATRLHTEVQWLLLKLGNDMRLDVWVAANDRNQQVNGHKFTELPHLRKELPLQFDAATTQIIRVIDVLWLKGNAIVAAFEIECTTSIYSGLLRMADLISMQPNLKIPLYLVAPDERKKKVLTEINRPTFSRLNPPMKEICRFLSISALREHLSQAARYIRFLSPEFLVDISESCQIEVEDI